jgi:hypothetical protein
MLSVGSPSVLPIRELHEIRFFRNAKCQAFVGTFDFKQWEKRVRYLTKMMIAVCLIASMNAQATNTWSSCLTITGVTNLSATIYNSIDITFSGTGISGCTSVATGGINFIVGTDGVTAANINGFFSQALLAFATGTQVMILYDPTVTNCAGIAIANGGYNNQC